ncbi:reticulocyte-binding protein 2 isoform X3 [Drosophila elegans]|uniref:reticulocyte-binding protein 2 isoform X3 n=1 Tax=Drosophila elegans TaxID=30023 RepID=UPI0007E6EE3A|nr:reticulocyte-binding protein 2 isoform X3 [Drosophila elegans]
MTAASLPRVPEGLRDLMKVYTKEVLREKPADLYGFSANFFNVIVGEKSHQMVRKYEPVQTYETIMKNRIRQQVPLSLVFNIIPEKLTDLIKQFIKAVLKEKPENIYIFAQEYFQRMSKEKSGRIEYSKYSTYEKSLKDKENVAPVSKVTCECGRTLSAKTQDGENTASAYTDTKLAEADQSTFSSSISYLQSVVIIQRNFRRYLKQRNIAREKDKCNSVEYVAAILLIQRQVRRLLAQKRVEKLKNSRDAPKPNAKFNTADYMKAVVVIQRHYRIYLTKKQEHNRLKNGPVSLATAAIVIQRAFRRMVALHRPQRSASSAADQGEELNDNASETGSYTSVSTALLSTESTELGIANYEERVHQKIIHEDEEVENNNVDVGLEKEYFTEPIKGAEKSIQQRKSEILSGALIENMICKPNLENIKDFNKESKDLEGDAEMIPTELENIKGFTNESIDLKVVDEISMEPGVEADKNIASQVLEPEIKTNKASLDLESAAQTGFNTERDEEELKSEKEADLKSFKVSFDEESETQVGLKDKLSIKDIDTKNLEENEGTDLVEREDDGFSDSNLAKEIKKNDNDLIEHALKTMEDSFDKLEDKPLEDKPNDEKDKTNEIFKIPKNIRSESELQEVTGKTEVSVSPAVSIEIEHVKDILEDSILTQPDTNVDSAKDLSDIDLLADESCVKPTIEIESLKSVLVNHNVRGQESSSEMNFEASTDALVPIKNQESVMLKSTLSEKDASIEQENKPSSKSREKRSIEDKESIQSKSESHEPLTKGDFVLQNERDENLKPIIQDEVQINNDKVLGESSEPISATEEIPRTQPNAENETILESIETVTNNVQESLEEVLKPMSEESSLDIPAQADDPINDCKEIMAKRTDITTDNSQIEDEPIGEFSDLSRVEAERESKIFDDLKANEEDLENLAQRESYELDKNVENSLNKSDHSLEKLVPDETEMEIKKLSNQETLLIGSESLETEKISPTEGAEEKVKPNGIDSSITNVIAATDINDSVEEILVQATTLLERDISESIKNDSELSDTQTENKEANEEIKTNNANAPTQSINTSIEDVIITDAKVTTEGANISQAEDEQLDKETVPFESDTMHLKDSKLQESIKTSAEDSVIADTKVPTEGSGISRSEDEQVDKETLLMESKSMHIEDSKQQDESKEIDKILTEQSKSLQLEDEESDKITSTIKPATEQVKEGKLENESSELDSYVPEVAKEEQEKYEPSANERSESLEKVLSTSQEIKSPCETFDSHRNSEEGVENLSQSNDGVMSMIDTANAVLESSEKIETALPDEEANKILESDSIVEHTINTTKEVGNEESLDQTKSEPGLEKKEPDEDHIVALEDDSPRPATKSGISDTLHVEQKDDSTDLIKNSPDVAEDTITEESKPKRESPSAPNPDVITGLTESSEAGLGSVEDPLLQSQSDFGGIVQSLDIASTQELVNNFLENEIEYSSRQRPFQPDEVIEEPCVKKSASLVNLLSEGESEPETVSQKAENTDSSVSETTGLETLSADTIDKATVKLSKPEEVIEKMSQMKESKSQDRLPSAAPSFDEPVVRPMSSLQEQYSLDIEDGDIIVYNRLQREETRESSAQSDSVVFGEAEAETIQLNEEESGRGHLMRHYTIAGDDPRGLFRSVTIDDALSYVEIGEKDMAINSSNSFCLDDETSENIRKKMMAYSLSETDSDYFDPRKTSTEDFDIDTAMADAMGTSTETESTIVSAATKIQAGARGFLTRRRLRRASAGTKSSTLDTKASFGNDAISESLERFIEEEAAKKIQAAYRMHTRKRKGHSRKMEGISLESNLAARRQKLQRGDALRNDSTPDDENSSSTSGGQAPKSSKIVKSKTVGDSKSKPDMELKWLKMRQNSMPVQIDCEVFRVIPKHMRKRIKSAEANKRK